MLWRLWIISALLETQLFFNIGHIFSITLSIPRILSSFVAVCLIAAILYRHPKNTVRSLSVKPLLWPAIYGTVLTIVVSCVLVVRGNDTLQSSPGMTIHNIDLLSTRVLIETMTPFFQVCYFVLLPSRLLNTRRKLEHFFRFASVVIVLNLLFGLADYILQFSMGYDLIPRSVSDKIDVGLRFHAFFGEPRDAVVFLLSIPFFIIVKRAFDRQQQLFISQTQFSLLIVLGMLTQSTTYLIALLIFAGVLVAYRLRRLTLKNLVKLAFVVTLLLAIVVFLASLSPRIQEYATSLSTIVNIDPEYDPRKVNPLLFAQYSNVYPLITVYNELLGNNIIGPIFGHGLGSAGNINVWMADGVFSNPNSQIVRLIYEYGLIGSIIFCLSYKNYVKNAASLMNIDKKGRTAINQSYLLMFSAFLAHRSITLMVMLGMLGAVATLLYRERNDSYRTNN